MTSPYADLRARLAPLAAAAAPVEQRGGWLLIDPEADEAFQDALLHAYPEFMALLVRGEAAEAEHEVLRGRLAEALQLFKEIVPAILRLPELDWIRSRLGPIFAVDAVALRDPS